ncbi:helix-turn-helix domain-containing protein [Rhodobacter aestuarii]|nr:helix-turn-helix transcriptional regulator [Rhodobacter aestuarii]
MMASDRLISSAQDAGKLIQERRRALKMSQEVLSSLTGVAQPNLSKIERGGSSATLDTYLRLFAALGIDLRGEARS